MFRVPRGGILGNLQDQFRGYTISWASATLTLSSQRGSARHQRESVRHCRMLWRHFRESRNPLPQALRGFNHNRFTGLRNMHRPYCSAVASTKRQSWYMEPCSSWDGICQVDTRYFKKRATWQTARPSLPVNLWLRRGKQPTEIMEITTKMQGGER